ncbi:MAG: hypothetical protein A3F91_09330 [Flavobacteria bacterium RIFCSPLOWO2_12_FULL_35_11]|nr:MAG: hypothetical protein A3F91_09330 [Flavobacteria bacterium RIFCSPLOWO2_12_FULL_35_11]
MLSVTIPSITDNMSNILDFYLKTVSIHKKSYSTEVYRIRSLNNGLGTFLFNEILPIHIISYRDNRLTTPHPHDSTRTLSGATVKLELMLLSHIFNTAISEWGMDILKNPVLKIRKPKVNPGRARRLTQQEEKALLRAAFKHQNIEFYAIITLALETAMRQGEILALLWENINWDKRTVFLPITKNGDHREVPLSRAAFTILRTYLTPRQTGKIFNYTSAGIKSTWRDFINSLGIENFHFHDLRHCAISSLLERGLNSIEVATISGHKSMSMLKRYAHIQSYKLVDKLDPKPKGRKTRALLKEHFQPYPAIITRLSKKITIDFPDFIDISTTGRDENKVIKEAQAFLLKKIVNMLCEGHTPPLPSPINLLNVRNRKKTEIKYISPI